MIQFTVISIILFGFLRWVYVAQSTGNREDYLLISCIVQTFPYGYGLMLYDIISYEEGMLGVFGIGFRLETLTVLSILLLLFGFKIVDGKTGIRENKWLWVLMLICVVSFVNPKNVIPMASLVPLSFVLQFLFLSRLVSANFSQNDIFCGIYDGLKVNTIFQFILCICYPVLGLEQFSTLFRGESALAWSLRREGVVAAVGTFGHSAVLALYAMLSFIFFLSSYLNGYRKSYTRYLLAMNLLIIYLTYSRTSLAVIVLVAILVVVVFRRGPGIFKLANILKVTSLFVLIVGVLYFTPLRSYYLESDSGEQFNNRSLHWLLGYQIWETSEISGVGLNTHVRLMERMFNANLIEDVSQGKIELGFFVTNPIHNIHIIILVEIGIVGFICWLYFFYSQIDNSSKKIRSKNRIKNIMNLTYMGVLIMFFLYGFYGWAPFEYSIIGPIMFIGYVASNRSIRS